MKSSCFYLSLIQAAGSHVKGNNDLSSESRCLRGCRHVSAVFTDRRHYFQQFYLLPELPFGRGRTQRYQCERYLQRVFSLYSFALFFSVFRFVYPTRDPLRNCNTSAPGFHLTIASDYTFRSAPDGRKEKQALSARIILPCVKKYLPNKSEVNGRSLL